MKTKTLFRNLTVLILLFTLITGCKKSTKEPVSSELKDQKLIEIYSKVGLWHNKSLDYVYKKIEEISSNMRGNRNNSDPEMTLLQLNEYAAEYLKDSLGFPLNDFTPYYFTDTLLVNNSSSVFQTSTFVSHYNSQYDVAMSSDLTSSLSSLENMLRYDTQTTNYAKYDSLIQVKVPLISNETDKAAFIACASVIKNSYQYWNENSDEWDRLFDNGQRQSTSNQNTPIEQAIKQMVWADGAGALYGLIKGAIAGAAGGTVTIPGIGTVVGGVCGGLAGGFVGGVSASATSAVTSFLQWVVGW